MRILLVEDNVDFARTISRQLGKIADCEVVWSRSRDAALISLADQSFDLVILDRRIPSADNVLDDHPDHGWQVFQKIRSDCPGTPVWFLTGNEDAEFASDVLNQYSRNEDFDGTRVHQQMYRVFWKRKVSDCLAGVREYARRLSELENIALSIPAGSRPLRQLDMRVLRIFGRRFNGAMISVTAMDGGLSDSRVLKAVVQRADGGLITTAVAKVATLPSVDDEGRRYSTDICRLAAGGFPALTERVVVGAGNHGGLFYGMVGDSVQNVFDQLAAAMPDASQIPAHIRAIEAPWYAAKAIRQVPVSRIRRLLIGDAELPAIQQDLEGIDIGPMEGTQISAACCCQHGDLHCANIVFDQRGHPMLIDFGDAGQSFAAVDPVTLELSTVFHTQRIVLPTGWPTEDLMRKWADLETYLNGCAFSQFVRGCRSWAVAEAASPQEIAAVGYAYGLRQLKYEDTDKALARSLIRSCIACVVG